MKGGRWLWKWGATGGAVVFCALVGVAGWKYSQWERWWILSDVGGRIEQVACLVNSARRSALRNAGAISSLVNALGPEVRVWILSNDRGAFRVVDSQPRHEVQWVDLPAESFFTIWPQDPFLVLENRRGRHVLLASAEFERADDQRIVEYLGKALGWPWRKSRLRFEGGNIVVGQEHVFVGAETIRWNAMKLGWSEVEVARAFERELGRTVLVLGPVPQPVGHIDMIVTPLSGRRLFVADAGWGAELAERELETNRAGVEAFERACEEYFFGDPGIQRLIDAEGQVIERPKVVGRTAEVIEQTRRRAGDLDRLAEELGKRGYRVLRVPILCPAEERIGAEEDQEENPAGQTSRGSESKTRRPRPSYPYLTYNNVLMERGEEGEVVYLPQYGWPAFDRAAVRAWEEAGFKVKKVGGLTISAMYGGSLRCCAKVLERSEAKRR